MNLLGFTFVINIAQISKNPKLVECISVYGGGEPVNHEILSKKGSVTSCPYISSLFKKQYFLAQTPSLFLKFLIFTHLLSILMY